MTTSEELGGPYCDADEVGRAAGLLVGGGKVMQMYGGEYGAGVEELAAEAEDELPAVCEDDDLAGGG